MFISGPDGSPEVEVEVEELLRGAGVPTKAELEGLGDFQHRYNHPQELSLNHGRVLGDCHEASTRWAKGVIKVFSVLNGEGHAHPEPGR
jgi:hypothetical protein